MFGYIRINKNELKFREYHCYKSYYCGMCMSIKKDYGELPRLTLNYDMTFLVVLLSSLYELKEYQYLSRCIAHPHKKEKIVENEASKYAASMNILLSYFKIKDDVNDEKTIKSRAQEIIFRPYFKKVVIKHSDKANKLESLLAKFWDTEKEEEIDYKKLSSAFGKVMEEVFDFKNDFWSKNLRKIGFLLGKYIYVLDALEDRQEDLKRGRFNPFNKSLEDEKQAKKELSEILAELEVELDYLPLEEAKKGIIENILYSGMPIRAGILRNREDVENERSI